MEIFNDFNTSVEKALSEIDPNWKDYEGLIVCGTHSPKDWEQQIEKIREARESRLPFLGICFGHQLAAIEYARNVLGIEGATSEEFYELETLRSKYEFIVLRRPEGLKVGLCEGESYWNYYEVMSGFQDIWKKSPNFITVQYHPEYQSSRGKPHKVLIRFLEYAREYTRNLAV